MPYASERQRRYMHAKHPDIAARWDEKYGGRIRRKPSKKRVHRSMKRKIGY